MQIWQTYRNADDIEGKGPMIPDKAFLHKKHAEEYIDSQPGIMGRSGKWSKMEYGDWTIKPVEVLEHSFQEAKEKEERLKYAALCKLTPEELKLLGLQGQKDMMDKYFYKLDSPDY